MKRRKKELPKFVDKSLLAIKKVPEKIVNAEKVAEVLLNKKMVQKRKASVRYKAAIKNYQTAVTRYKRASTLLEKHFKILTKITLKHSPLK